MLPTPVAGISPKAPSAAHGVTFYLSQQEGTIIKCSPELFFGTGLTFLTKLWKQSCSINKDVCKQKRSFL